jgi:hypothetical protein
MGRSVEVFPIGSFTLRQAPPIFKPLLRTAGSYAVAAFACVPFISHSA